MNRTTIHWIWPDGTVAKPAKNGRKKNIALARLSHFSHLRKSALRTDSCETCPTCSRVLTALAGCDAESAVTVIDQQAPQADFIYYTHTCGAESLGHIVESIDDRFRWFRVRLEQKRLSRIKRDYPHSKYCAGCGYILKRR